MRRARFGLLIWVILGAGAGALPALADSDVVLPVHTPFWIPREIALGSYLFGSVVSPTVELKWEAALYQHRIDTLMFVLEGAGSYGTKFAAGETQYYDPPINYLYQYSVAAELGYRMDRPGGFSFSFHAGAGPLFYGARARTLSTENLSAGTVVGRMSVGWRVGKVTTGVTGGFSAPFNTSVVSYSAVYLGGFFGGVYVNWR